MASGKATLARLTPPDNELCQACRFIREMKEKEKIVRIKSKEREQIRKAANTWSNKHLPPIKLPGGEIAQRAVMPTANGNQIIINKRFFSETFAKNIRNKHLAETMEIATSFAEWFEHLEYIRTEDGIDHDCKFEVY